MAATADLYNTSYSRYAAQIYQQIRAETYGTDLGQTGWMTAAELDGFVGQLRLPPPSHLLEVGCGAGGCAVHVARTVGCTVTGVDLNESAVANARKLAAEAGGRLQFEQADASRLLPFPDQSFDAVFSNDAMCHLSDRLNVLREWRRVLKPGGRMLFTDAMVITGAVTNEEIALRSSIGFYLFVAPGENERLIASAGLQLLSAVDLTRSEAQISARWRAARAQHQAGLQELEGPDNFERLQRFLECVHTLSSEGRLSRFAYCAER